MDGTFVFKSKDVQAFNEQAVREEIIAPLINFLGYAAGTEHNVSYEKSLRYPRVYLGRKNFKKDSLLRGAADYVLDASGRVRWVIEAKAAGGQISIDDIEQAYTYAAHAEVRAVYFSLCNGHEFLVFETNSGPDVGPIFAIKCDEFEEKKQQLHNLLSPNALLRRYPTTVLDMGIPLATGLGSIAKIKQGYIAYDKCSLDIPLLRQMQVYIIGGTVQRYDDHVVAFIETRGPNRILQKLMESMNLLDFEMTTSQSFISTDPNTPSVFEMAEKTMRFPAGSELIDPFTSNTMVLQEDVESRVSSTAIGHFSAGRISGRFFNRQTIVAQNIKIQGEGNFEIVLQ